MKLKRLISIVLTLVMLFSSLPQSATVYATENEEKQIDVTTADYPIMIKDRINTARLTKIGQYSELTEEEKDAVCKYYGLEDSIFVACEREGYNILDSVRIAKAANAAEITPAEYKEYVSAYGSEEEASFQLQIYKLFEDKLDAEYKSEYTELMKEGYSHTALRNTYDVAKTIDVSIKSIVPNDPETIAVTGTETDLEKFAAKNFCDLTKLQKAVASKNISTTVLMQGGETVLNKTDEIVLNAENEASQTAELNSTSSNSFEIDSPIHSLKHEFISAPSTNDYPAANEEINTATGGVGYRENVVDLKGKNGLDLDLDLVFTPNSNMYFGYVNNVRTDWFNSAGVNAYAIDTPLGIGWSFNLPYVSYTYEYDLTVSARNRHVYRYHMKDGGAYKIVDDQDSTNLMLEDYPRDDIYVQTISGTADGIPLRYKVVFADGRYETFDENGQIRETGDRFGNKITYDYYMEYDGVLESEDGVPGALGRITDSLGRKIEIGYQQNRNFPDRLVNIMLPDYSLIQLSLEAEDFDEPYLLQYITNRPGNTTFTYRADVMYCTDEPYIIGNIITTSDGRNHVANIAAITYNTGLTSRFAYETIDVNNGVGGVKQVMRVTERYESYTNEDVYDISQVLKYAVYDYTWDYSGYSRRLTAIESQKDLYADPNNLPDTYSYMVGKTENLIHDYTIFNSNHQARGIYVQQAYEGEDGYYNLRRETYKFDDYQMPIRKQVYYGTKVKSVELFENDSKGNVLKHWSKYSDDVENSEYLATYTYSDAYNLLTSATYKQNADKTITETYSLSSDGKSVIQKEVKENDTVKERTAYTYDTYGNVTMERKYISDIEYVDVNYDYTDTTGKTRPTGSNFNGAYLTKMWQSGGNDIDGNAIGNVEYTYEYDDRGRQTKATDPLGNSTIYTYDTFNRITQIKNPDNKTQSFSYVLNSTTNTTTHTDENGTQTKYTYDSANNLLSVIDVTSGEELKSYTYDRWYRAVEERNVQLMTSGCEIFYTYDGLNRILIKETKNYNDTTVAKELGDYNFGETKEWNITTITTVGDTTYAPDVNTVEYVNNYGDVDKIGYITGTNEYFTTYKYDYLGNKTEELSALADQKDWTNTFTSKWEYDYAGRVTKEYDATGKYSMYEYDWLGRPVKFYDKAANASEIPYYTSYLYDALGNVIQETVPQTETTNKITKFKYDKLGRMVEKRTLYDIADGAEQYQTVSYTYDWRGNVLTATQGGVTTTYVYDNLGRCLTSTTDGKTTTYTYDRFGNCLTETFGGKTDTYEYDMNGNRTKHTDPTGARILYEPDAMQKVYAISPSSESGGRTFEYTLTGKLLIGLDATGVGVVRRWHDDRGNATMEQNTGMTKYYTYDIEGKRESFRYDDVSLTYTYNTLGQLTAVNNADVPVVSYTYDNNGNVATEAKSAVTQTYTYNRDGSIASIVTTNNIDNTSETTSYTYYLNGNLKTETLPDNTTKTYTYNSRDMLETEALSTGKTTTYAYNNSGNRTSKTVAENGQNTVTSYTYDTANRLTQEQTGSSSITYTYDDNGRLISRTSGGVTDTFAYNGYNEMKTAVVGGVTTSYTYYVDGLRRSKKIGSNTSYEFWDGDNIIADTVSGYTIGNNYIRGLRLAEISNSTATQQYTFNAHGDVIGLVDTTTGAVTDYTYDAYGNEENSSATDTNPFRYSGEYYDAETGFIYLRARYYDPSIGRFIAEDPIRDGTNWYVYCYNNPVKYIDPWGLFGENTKLSHGQSSYTLDVVVMQRRLVELGYLDMSDDRGWGYFGSKTEDAVNNYKEKNGLWNFGEYKGVVGETTWKHMGLSVDHTYQHGEYTGTPEAYGRGTFSLINNPTIRNGILLGSLESGLVSIGGKYKYGSWEVDALNADAAAGFTTTYVGAQIGARLVSAEAGVKIPIPYTEKSLYVGGEGELFGIGFRAYYEKGKLKIGASAIVGAGIVIGLE